MEKENSIKAPQRTRNKDKSSWKRKWKGMKMASCLVPQGFPVRSGCIDKVLPPEKREALWSQ
jgi:hypothetical protein